MPPSLVYLFSSSTVHGPPSTGNPVHCPLSTIHSEISFKPPWTVDRGRSWHLRAHRRGPPLFSDSTAAASDSAWAARLALSLVN